MNGSPAALQVQELAKSFGDEQVLTGLDLCVPAGGLTAVLGRSGGGKTTLLRLIAGLERADSGRISIGGAVVCDETVHRPPERRRIGYVAQEGALFPHLPVTANVAFGLGRAARRGPHVERMLELVGLGGLGARMPHQLSGGQQQRVALVRALAPGPSLVLLDEPFPTLDPGLRAALRADVQAALEAAGTTALLVTHDQEEALAMAGQIAVLRDGRIVQAGSPATLYHTPPTPHSPASSATPCCCPLQPTDPWPNARWVPCRPGLPGHLLRSRCHHRAAPVLVRAAGNLPHPWHHTTTAGGHTH